MSSNEIINTLKDGVRIIEINRPKRKNALDINFYKALTSILNADADDDNVVVTILTGRGEYYSSGFDIVSSMEQVGTKSNKTEELRDLIRAIITYPKIIIALVNGPAIGIAVTTAALCDVIYASDKATFHTPFVNLGLCAEGCSSFTFPAILGRSKASEMILLAKKITAEEAYRIGLVSEVIPHQNFEQFKNQLKKLGKNLSANTVKVNKKLFLSNFKDILLECCDRELEQLNECFLSEEFSEAAAKFFSRKSKL